MVWLRASFHGQCSGPLTPPTMPNDGARFGNEGAVIALFKMTKRLRDRGGMTWAKARELLQDAREALGALNQDWKA